MDDPLLEIPPPQQYLGLRRRRPGIIPVDDNDQHQEDAAAALLPPPLPQQQQQQQQPEEAPDPPVLQPQADLIDRTRHRRWQQQRNNNTGNRNNNNNNNTTTNNQNHGAVDNSNYRHSHYRYFKVSHLYCIVSTLLAVLAIVVTVPASNSHQNVVTNMNQQAEKNMNINLPPSSSQWGTTAEQVVKAAAVGVAARRGEINTVAETNDLLQSMQQWWNMRSQHMLTHSSSSSNNAPAQQQQQQQQQQRSPSFFDGSETETRQPINNHQPPNWLKWMMVNKPSQDDTKFGNADGSSGKSSTTVAQRLLQFIDPAIRHPTPHTPTDIIEKVLTSTPRLLAIANFLLAMTYLLHSAVAAWFLGQHNTNNNTGNNPSQHTNNNSLVVDWSTSAGARERMGGFLVFKLLLISAVVAPDTLDLLILLTWYTMLSCLRSLDHLAHATTTHLAALGQPPRSGVVKLEFLVLVCNILAAATCVALFHAAGWGMVLLLTCDCALLAADVLSHILKHVQCVLDDQHSETIQSLEDRQLDLHNNRRPPTNNIQDTTLDEDDHPIILEGPEEDSNDGGGEEEEEDVRTMPPYDVQEESRRLDQQMEVLELGHARRLSVLESVMFGLELLCHLLTVAHFCHIWSLHGVQFTLIDGVLALHLHSAVSSACKKIAQRRNMSAIARDLQGLFPNASDQELRKASLAGDVCCICLGSMSTGGHVKKVRCGHLYHTHCLREVVERAQSIQAAKCPLCRASVLDGRRDETNGAQRAQTAVAQQPIVGGQAGPLQQQQQNPPQAGGERALFRFSTEGIFPAWIPIPAFSFEVVRRPTQPPAPPPATPAFPPQPRQVPDETNIEESAIQNDTTATDDNGNIDFARMEQREEIRSFNVPEINNYVPANSNIDQRPAEEQQRPASFLRRLLVLAGAIPMSPEEEARALAHLVEMFPQYDRSDLLRELRERGSAESVAEAVLMGIFSGVPRGG